MLGIDLIGRLRRRREQQVYRRQLTKILQQDVGFLLLPRLRTLPLVLEQAGGGPCSLPDAARARSRITLSGPSSSGRGLALRQLALRWLAHPASEEPMPLYIDLAQLDDGTSAPETLLQMALRRAQQPETAQNSAEPVDLYLEPDAGLAWQLLIYGWEDLEPARRSLWRTTLLGTSLPECGIIVVLPDDEPAWPGYMALLSRSPSLAVLEGWVEHLAPTGQRDTLMGLLAPGGTIASIGERLFDIALAAWVAQHTAVPSTRVRLYEAALALLFKVPVEQLANLPLALSVQRYAAYGEPSVTFVRGLLERSPTGKPYFCQPQMRRYLAARQFAADTRFDLIVTREPAERAEIVLLMCGMLSDPAPLYAALWSMPAPVQERILLLGECLREHAPRGSLWALRIGYALAGLARQQGTPHAARANALLLACQETFEQALVKAASMNQPPRRLIRAVLGVLPHERTRPVLEQLCYAASTAEAFGWELVDLLLEQSDAGRASAGMPLLASSQDLAHQPTDLRALVRWQYVHMIHDAASRRFLYTHDSSRALHSLGAVAGASRRTLAAGAVLADSGLPVPIRLEALKLLRAVGTAAALDRIEQASTDESPAVRAAALAVLAGRDRERAEGALARVVFDSTIQWETRLDAIEHLGAQYSAGAGQLIERCATDRSLPLYARIQVIRLLGRRSECIPFLGRVAMKDGEPIAVRTAALRQLIRLSTRGAMILPAGRRGKLTHTKKQISARPGLRRARRLGAERHSLSVALARIVEDRATPSGLAIVACEGLGILGGAASCDVLLRVLERSAGDIALTLAAIQGLAQLRSLAAIPALSNLLGSGALSRLQSVVPPGLVRMVTARSLEAQALPAAMEQRLTAVIAECLTPADLPTTLSEFLVNEADRIRTAAARALVAIGGEPARSALLAALLAGGTGNATVALIDALARIKAQGDVEALRFLLNDTGVSQHTRWLVAQRLLHHPDGEEIMRHGLMNTELDGFTRGVLAEGLGRRRVRAVLPLLSVLARDQSGDTYLRTQAIIGLGLIDDQASEAVLLDIADDPGEDGALRGLAAEHLPSLLSSEGRRTLRGLLRGERLVSALVVGVLRTLGRIQDHEALPLMLRHCLDEQGTVVQAAIAALAAIGDPAVTPALVRISQSPTVDRMIRLQAIGALLRIGDQDYSVLLRTYLSSNTLPLQLQALEYLISVGTPLDQLAEMLANRSWPQPYRLRLLDAIGSDPLAAPVLLSILYDDAESIQLRGRAAAILGRTHCDGAKPALIEHAANRTLDVPVRLRCVEALSAIGGAEAWQALSLLAEAPEDDPALRERASMLLGMRRANAMARS